jgi:hypothetical protein
MDAVEGVHGGHRAERSRLLGHQADEVVIMLSDQAAAPGALHVHVHQDFLHGDRHIGPPGLLGQFPAGRRVEVLVALQSAARRGPVLALGRRVPVMKEQHPPARIDRDHPSREPHGVVSLRHVLSFPRLPYQIKQSRMNS